MVRDLKRGVVAVAGVALVTVVYGRWLHIANGTIVALTFLLIVLVVAAQWTLWIALATSVAAMLCFNFFFLPPVGTLTIADPQNWVALVAFLAVSFVAAHLSSVARDRTSEAVVRRDEIARLFDLSRDVLLTTDSASALSVLPGHIARRFELDYVAICLPFSGGWRVAEGGSLELKLEDAVLERAAAAADSQAEYVANARAYFAVQLITADGHAVRIIPLRLGARPLGLLAMAGRPLEAGALDALGGVVAIAIERAHFLEELKTAEGARQREELKSALLASIGHDLRTPLTAIRVAASNLRASWLTEAGRREQSEIVLTEVGRLTREFENILEMARIDAGAIQSTQRWVHPSEIIDAARVQVEPSLRRHALDVEVATDTLVRIDPRLTAAALAHLLENAAQCSPAGSSIAVRASTESGAVTISVRDRGAGIPDADLPHLFERFYRGSTAKTRASGTGMGLAIARGLLAVERGRVWGENDSDGGARFTIAVPAEMKADDGAGRSA